jgi:LDH2 family malate/lactate/ureidoglycolate dehydrogenase
MGIEIFKRIAGTICRQIRSSEKAPGEDQIFTPGEKEYIAWQYRQLHGLPVSPALQQQVSELSKRFKLSYAWPWE